MNETVKNAIILSATLYGSIYLLSVGVKEYRKSLNGNYIIPAGLVLATGITVVATGISALRLIYL